MAKMREHAEDRTALHYDEDSENSEPLPDIQWTEEHENILVDWADKAMCYRWLHSKSNQRFSKRHTLFTIPVIIMSTLTGTANFAQDRFPDEYRDYVPMMIGAVNIFAGILTTVQQFLKISELNEAHRVASISWDKFYRNIRVELAKRPRERMNVAHMLKASKEEFDRLMETSPVISDDIVELFKKTFGDMKEPDSVRAKTFEELKKPEICDSLESTRHIVYRSKTVIPRTLKLAATSIAKAKRKLDHTESVAQAFIGKFHNEYSRAPTAEEVYDNLNKEVDMETIQRLITKHNEQNNATDGDMVCIEMERAPPLDQV